MKADNFLSEVEGFLKRNNLSATRFGALAAGDTKFVKSLRDGRRCREATKEAVRGYMSENEGR